jgi:hypothetical protein
MNRDGREYNKQSNLQCTIDGRSKNPPEPLENVRNNIDQRSNKKCMVEHPGGEESWRAGSRSLYDMNGAGKQREPLRRGGDHETFQINAHDFQPRSATSS